MSGLSAAATLSLKIDTGGAAEELLALQTAYGNLKTELGTSLKAVGGVSAMEDQLKKAKATIQDMDKALKTSAAAYATLEQEVKARSKNIAVAYSAAFDGGRIAAKKAIEGMTTDQVVELAKQQGNLQRYRATLMKHYEMISRDARASASSIKTQIEALTSTPVGLDEMRTYYKQLETFGKTTVAEAVASLKAQEKAENESSTRRLAAATKVVGARTKAETEYSAWWATELAKRERLEQDQVAQAVTSLKAQEKAENESSARRLAAATKVVGARTKAETEYSAWWATELAKRERLEQDQVLQAVANLKAQEQAEALSNAKRLKDATAAITARRTKEAEYTTWWLAELAKRDRALTISTTAVNKAGHTPRNVQRVAGFDSLMNTTTPVVQPVVSPTAAKSLQDATNHQLNWNKAANEGHAFARGLSGALGTLWMTYGSMAPLLAGAAIAGGFVQATKAGSEFAYQLTFVKELGEESAGSIETISKKAQELAQSSLYGPVELADGLRILSQAGLSAADSIRALPQATNLATVGEMSMEQAAITLTGVMNAFSLSVADMPRIGDVFAKAAALSQTSVDGMTQSMKTASVVGEQYGASMEDTATALTLLAKVNITGTAAGTSFRNMVKELYAPVPQAAAAMRKLGLETKDAAGNLIPFADIIYDLKGRLQDFDKAGQVQILQRLFGERGAKEAVAMLSQTRDEWEKLKSSLTDSEGFMEKVASGLEATAKGQWKQAINTLQVELIRAFESVEPTLLQITKLLKEMFSSSEFRNGLNSVVQGMAEVLKALVTYGPVIVEAGKAWLVYAAGSAAAKLAMAAFSATAVSAVGRAALFAQTLTAVAAGSATTITGLTGLTGAMALLGGPIGIVTGLVVAGGAAWLLYRDKTAEAMEGSTLKVKAFASDAKVALDEIARTIGTTTSAMSKMKLEKVGGDVVAINDRLSDQRDLLKKKYGITNEDEVKAVINAATTVGIDGNIYTDESPKYRAAVAYNEALEARNKLTETYYRLKQDAQDIEDAEQNKAALAAGVAVTGPKRSVSDILGSGAGGSGRTRVGRDYDFNIEKSAIEDLKAQQQQKVAILESARSSNLISEGKYRADLQAINDEFDGAFETQYQASFARLKKIADTDATDKGKQALDHYNQMLANHRKFLNDKELNLVKSNDREKGIIKKAQEDLDAFLLKMGTESAKSQDRLRDTRRKQTMSPEAVAAYDATRASDDQFDEQINKQKTVIKNLDETPNVDRMSDSYLKQVSVLRQLTAEKERYGKLAGDVARAEAAYARSFESGWKTAMNNYVNDAGNSARMAEKAFGLAVNSMDSALTEFLETGTVDWRKMFNSMLVELIKMETRWMISKIINPSQTGDSPLMGGLKSIGGGLEKLLGTGETVAEGPISELAKRSTDAEQALETASSSVTKLDKGVEKLTVSKGDAEVALVKMATAAEKAATMLERLAGAAQPSTSSPVSGASGALAAAAGAGKGASEAAKANPAPSKTTSGSSSSSGGSGSYFDEYYYENYGPETAPGYAPGDLGNGITLNGGSGVGYTGSGAAWDTSFDWAAEAYPEEEYEEYAKGGAFTSMGAIRAFATGGVVNSPTFFKFADGGSFSSGVMGEAGPEAILPLSRGSDGRLGVTATGLSPAGAGGAGGMLPTLVSLFSSSFGSMFETVKGLFGSLLSPFASFLPQVSSLLGGAGTLGTGFLGLSDAMTDYAGTASYSSNALSMFTSAVNPSSVALTELGSSAGDLGKSFTSVAESTAGVLGSLSKSSSVAPVAKAATGVSMGDVASWFGIAGDLGKSAVSASRGDYVGAASQAAKVAATGVEKLGAASATSAVEVAKGGVQMSSVFSTLGSSAAFVTSVLSGNIPGALASFGGVVNGVSKVMSQYDAGVRAAADAATASAKAMGAVPGFLLDTVGSGLTAPGMRRFAAAGLGSEVMEGFGGGITTPLVRGVASGVGYSGASGGLGAMGGANGLSSAVQGLQTQFASLGTGLATTGTALTGLGTATAVTQTGVMGLGTSTIITEGTIAATGATTLVTQGALASTAVSAQAASVGLASVAASSGAESTGSMVGAVLGAVMAKGGVVGRSGLHAFAKGGAFTNQVVSSPTFFQFANGGQFSTGVMGEAGDEAVMPLRRDSQGRLGVTAARTGQAAAPAEAPPPPQNNIRIVNAFDTSVIGDYMGSVDGEKVIMNAVKKNPSMIKQMARA